MAKAKPQKSIITFKPSNRVPSPISIGVDLSPSSLAVCAKQYDGLLKKMKGPVWHLTRWPKDTDQFEKLEYLARGYDVILDLLAPLGGFINEVDDLHIGVEELPKRVLKAQRMQQHSELIGCFVGSLLKYGWKNVHMINIMKWQARVASDFDQKITKDFKWTVKEWAIELGAPRWKDLIYNGKKGLIPKPKKSKARPTQPDDRYDALGIEEYVWDEYYSGVI